MNQGMSPRGTPLIDWSPPPERDWKWLLFSFEGRISRREYWKGSMLMALGCAAVSMVLGVGLAFTQYFWKVDLTIALPIMVVVLVLPPAVWASLGLGIKRIHDRNKSGYWVLIAFVPYIGAIWTFIEWGCLVGTKGPNDFGPDPVVE